MRGFNAIVFGDSFEVSFTDALILLALLELKHNFTQPLLLQSFPLDRFGAWAITFNFPSDKNLKGVLELVPRFKFLKQELCRALYEHTILIMCIESFGVDKELLSLVFEQLDEFCLSVTLACAVDAYIRVLALRIFHLRRCDTTTSKGHKL